MHRKRAFLLGLSLLGIVTFAGTLGARESDLESLTLEIYTPLGHKFNEDADQRVSFTPTDSLEGTLSPTVLTQIRLRLNDQGSFQELDSESSFSFSVSGIVQSVRLEFLVPRELQNEAEITFFALYCEVEDERYCVIHEVRVSAGELREGQNSRVHLPLPAPF